jgi:hypothetical protein
MPVEWVLDLMVFALSHASQFQSVQLTATQAVSQGLEGLVG